MTINQIKLVALAFFAIPLISLAIFNTKNIGAASDSVHIISKRDDAATIYKAKCSVCHTPKAEKFFETAKKDDELVEIILKGKKAAKPPHMPEYESKGITKEQAKDLVEYMRKLKNPDAGNNDSKDAKDAKAEAREETEEKAREAIIALYKKSCAACHSAKAEKFYNPEMKEDEQVRIILKGKQAAKPPHMPGFESKGITEKQASALAAYMIELRTPSK